MITIENLTKSYRIHNGRHYVFKDINAVFPDGANIGILGPNGSGKSTLLRILGGIDFPDSGRVTSTASFSWPLGLKGGFVKHASGRENCLMICNLYGLGPQESKKQLEAIKEISGIGEYFSEPVATYSSGMSARLGFALSMSFDFEYFLIDEITSVGDASFKVMAKELLRQKAAKARIIMVSHSMGDIREFCDMGVVLKNGQLEVFEDLDGAIDSYLAATAQSLSTSGIKDKSNSSAPRLVSANLPTLESLPTEIGPVAVAVITRLRSVKHKHEAGYNGTAEVEAESYSLLGRLHRTLGNFAKAERFHKHAVKKNPALLNSLHALVELAGSGGNRQEEALALEAAESVDSRNAKTVVLKVRSLLKKGEVEEALKTVRFLLDDAPEHADGWHAYATVLHHKGAIEDALDAQLAAIKKSPNQPAYYQQLARILEEIGDVENAVLAFCKAHSMPGMSLRKRLEEIVLLLERIDEK